MSCRLKTSTTGKSYLPTCPKTLPTRKEQCGLYRPLGVWLIAVCSTAAPPGGLAHNSCAPVVACPARVEVRTVLGALFCCLALTFTLRDLWPLGRREDALSKALAPISQNVTWHGRSLVANISSHLRFTQHGDLQLLSRALVAGGLNISALARFSMTSLSPEDPEVHYLGDSPLTDPLTAANETTSRVIVLGASEVYSVGDSLHVRVDVYDGRGRPLQRGGDQVRLWAVDPAQQASLATEVTDLRNGSYLASVPLLWAGQVHIKASLTYNREVLRAISFVKAAVRTTKFLAAGFFSDLGNAATLCATYPLVPGGYRDLCDLSDRNGGLPWYCGKPANPALSCNHWTHVADIQFVHPLPLTHAENVWMQWLDVPKNLRVVNNFQLECEPSSVWRGIPSIKVKPVRPVANVKSKPQCTHRSFRDTWSDSSPRGFWLKQVWTPMACTMPGLVAPRVASCLRDTTVLLLGDSNLRLALAILKDLTSCELDTAGEVKPKWHRPMRCVNAHTKTEIRWRTHAHPFHTGQQDWSDRRDQKAAHEYIDEVPKEGRFLIVVHLYLHFTTELLSVFRAHIRAVRASVQRLLARNRRARVVLRAPHAASQFWPTAYSTDSFAWALTDTIKAEFAGLYDKVLFLQPWDMTVAAENVGSHPADYINRAIMNLMLSHLC
ncbi:hypothetical protein EGW08_008379 [Elysia chlorotica]|uniref:NXPE C-terminal domain-containing protein n=1 Tax=Elysia chlorotica TaxID=188477 RepID=A0A433TQR8_ELYCH|nr:hypothetical protein EGW08_008379 [Elysia chlorotica]